MVNTAKDVGNEYYPLKTYAKDHENNEIYAVKNGGQFYWANDLGVEVMARRYDTQQQLNPFFALDPKGHPVCPLASPDQTCLKMDIAYVRDSKGTELYPKRDGHEYYIDRGLGMVYAKDKSQNEYYARNKLGQSYYASKVDRNETIEYPAKNSQGEPSYIVEGDRVICPINITLNRPLYTRNKAGKEMYFKNKDGELYGCNVSRLPIYAKDKEGNDYLATRNGSPYYSYYDQNGVQYQYYPKLKNNREFYVTEGQKEIYARFDRDERYARSEAAADILAQENTIPYYATNQHNIEMYPLLNGDHKYRVENNVEQIAVNKTTLEGSYAKRQNNDEFYPMNFNPVPEDEGERVVHSVYKTPTLEEIQKHASSSP